METPEDGLYLSADEAAAILGISLATLYAYVSRKNIRSLKVDGSRSRRYWAADIQRLAKPKNDVITTVTEPPRVAASSAITLLTDKGLYYRGQDVAQLAETASVEEVAELMWQSPGAFGDTLPKRPKAATPLLKAYAEMHPVEKAIALFPLIERENPKAYDLSPEGYARTGVDVVRWLAALMVGADGPSTQPLPTFIVNALGVDSAFEDLVRQVVILSMDHELDPSTYTVRAAANTGVTPYYAGIIGLAASRGRRLAYSRGETVGRLLEEICTAHNPQDPVLQRYREGEAIPGFGSNMHGVADPRAQSLWLTLQDLFAGDIEFQRLLKAAQIAQELLQQPPDFILLLSFVGRKLKLEGRELALPGIGRVIGWLAHASEQYHHQTLIRPRAKYTGILPD